MMAKRTAIVDIGSNSVKLIIYEKTSRFGFYKIKEVKSTLKLSEGSFQNGGVLQKEAMQRAYSVLNEFAQIIKAYVCRKTLCIGTSALRDAPNKGEFVNEVRRKTGINVKVINGEKEAYLGAVSAVNLLSKIDDAITVDIGGGSTELALIKNGKIERLYSLDLGSVRIKESFNKTKKAVKFIQETLQKIPKEFNSSKIISMGGTTRELAKLIKENTYPIKDIHNFEYKVKKHIEFIKQLPVLSELELEELSVSSNRVDTIREGTLIFGCLLEHFETKKVIVSKTGIREGLYLTDLLRNSNHTFPANFNVSVRTLIDQFDINRKNHTKIVKIAKELFETLASLHECDEKYKQQLIYAVKLLDIGKKIDYDDFHKYSFNIIMNNLPFGFTHKEKLLVASLIRFQTNKLYINSILEQYAELLPDLQTITWLSFITTLSKSLLVNLMNIDFSFKLENNALHITSPSSVYLVSQAVENIQKPVCKNGGKLVVRFI
jgi:exopolyphosphatase/guanosine-5'-triphosphate,3'-diphosphate pyrophosphatase